MPEHADELLVHVRDYTKGHPSIPANNHPVRHGPVVGIHNGIIMNDDELLAPHSCARAEPRMTVDSEAIFALAAHSQNDPRALEALAGSMATAWLDEREPGTVFAARGVGRPLWLGAGRNERLLRLDAQQRSRSLERVLRASSCGSARSRGTFLALRDGAVVARDARFRPDRSYVEADAAPGGPRTGRERLLPRRASPRSRRGRLASAAASRRARPRRPRSSRRSRTRNWNVDQAPRRASNMR